MIGGFLPGKLTLLEKAFPNCIQPYIIVSWGQWARLAGSEASGWVFLEPVSLSHANTLAWQNPPLS
ncbi:MAG: hypothetical protein F6K26_14430 [Moorea sp. SIO2I5]|nr:hypothetical protein [Moorena sp. SIO2I5]